MIFCILNFTAAGKVEKFISFRLATFGYVTNIPNFCKPYVSVCVCVWRKSAILEKKQWKQATARQRRENLRGTDEWARTWSTSLVSSWCISQITYKYKYYFLLTSSCLQNILVIHVNLVCIVLSGLVQLIYRNPSISNSIDAPTKHRKELFVRVQVAVRNECPNVNQTSRTLLHPLCLYRMSRYAEISHDIPFSPLPVNNACFQNSNSLVHRKVKHPAQIFQVWIYLPLNHRTLFDKKSVNSIMSSFVNVLKSQHSSISNWNFPQVKLFSSISRNYYQTLIISVYLCWVLWKYLWLSLAGEDDIFFWICGKLIFLPNSSTSSCLQIVTGINWYGSTS